MTGKNPHDIKIIFFDVDGTLVPIHHESAPASAVKALRKLKEKGIKLIISSGRHLMDIEVLGLPVFDGYITTNGASCMVDGKVIFKQYIPQADIERLVTYLQGSGRFPCIIETDDNAYLNYTDRYTDQLQRDLKTRKPVLCDLDLWSEKTRSGVIQMLGFFDVDKEGKIMRDILPGCVTKRWCSYFTDIIQKDCDKAKGIEKILDHYHFLPEEAMAFGDGGNDLTMLQYVGVGIAMGNAADKVKAVADFVTSSVEEDGIYKGLEDYGLI